MNDVQVGRFGIPVALEFEQLKRDEVKLKRMMDELGKRMGEGLSRPAQAAVRGLIRNLQAQGVIGGKEFANGMRSGLRRLHEVGVIDAAQLKRLTGQLGAVGEAQGTETGRRFRKGAQTELGALPRWVKGAFAGGMIAGFAFIANRVVQLFRSAAERIQAVLRRAGDTAQITRAFGNIAQSTGGSAPEILGALRQGARGMVSDLELMTRANMALQAGIPATAQSMGELAFISRRLAEAVGRDATEAFERMVNGIAKGEQQILEELGLMSRMEDSLKRWSEQTGKNGDDLTQHQKTLIFYNDVLEEGRRKVAAMGDEQFDAGKRLQQVTAWWENLKNATAEALAESPRVLEFFNKLGSTAEGAAGHVQTLSLRAGAAFDTLLDFLNLVGRLNSEVEGGTGSSIWGIGIPMDAIRKLAGPKFEENLFARRHQALRENIAQEEDRNRLMVVRANVLGAIARERDKEKGQTRELLELARTRIALEERLMQLQTVEGGGVEVVGARVDRKDAAKQAENRAKLLKQLANDVFALNASAAEAAIRQIDELGEAYVAAGGRIEDVAAQLDALKQRITEGGALQALREEFDGLRRDSLDMGDLPEINAFIESAAAERDALAETNPLREEYNALIGQAIRLTGELEQAAKKAAEEEVKHAKKVRDFWRKADAEVARAQEERLRNLRDQARLIDETVGSALQLAEAFGLVGSEAAATLEKVGQLATAAARMAGSMEKAGGGFKFDAATFDFAAAFSAAGAIASLVTVLMDDTEGERQREAMTQLTEAIHRLRETMQPNVSGGRVRQLQDSLQWLLGGNVREVAEGGQIFRALKEIEELLGLQAGTLVNDSGKVASQEVLREALRALQEMQFGAFGDDVSGRLSAFNFLMSQLGDAAGSAADRLDMLLEMLSGMGQGGFLGEFEKALREGGPEAANAFLDEIAARLAAGDQSLFAAGGLFEFMTAEEARQLLEQLNQSVDDILGGGGGTTRDFVRTSVIREVTANRLEGLLHTGNFHLASIDANIATMLATQGITPASMGAPISAPAYHGAGGGGMTVYVSYGSLVGEINVGAGTDPSEARLQVTEALETFRTEWDRTFEGRAMEAVRNGIMGERSAHGRHPRTGK